MSVKILVVDDSKVERNYLAGLLTRLGTEPDITDGCEEGVLRACEEQYDLMLIDYMMPDADGVHTLKEIQRRKESLNAVTPAVALGSPDDTAGEDFFILAGFVNYIEKPVNYEMLHAALLLYLPEDKRGEVGNSPTATEKEDNTAMNNELAWLNEVEELSVEDGIKNCGSEEGFVSALNIFFNSIDNMADEIRRYYDKARWKNYTIKVHALKSSARIIGLSGLSELARQLEAAGDGGNLDFIHEKTDELLSWYRSFKDKLGRLAQKEEEDDSNKPVADRDFLEDAYSSLIEFASQMDLDMTEEVINSMEEYRFEPDDTEIFEELISAYMNLDWNGIKAAAQKYMDKLYGEGK